MPAFVVTIEIVKRPISENTLKISPTSSKSLIERSSAGKLEGATKQTGKYTAAHGSAHTVDLSAAGRQLALLQSSTQDIDLEKVHAIRLAIARGELKIDTSKIADGLLSTARELIK